MRRRVHAEQGGGCDHRFAQRIVGALVAQLVVDNLVVEKGVCVVIIIIIFVVVFFVIAVVMIIDPPLVVAAAFVVSVFVVVSFVIFHLCNARR